MKSEGAWIRFLVVAFPAGLLLIGVAVMMVTHLNPGRGSIDPNEAARLEAAALSRRAVNQDDLRSHLNILAGTIGERHLGKPEKLEQAALWIESTLGGANTGYRVQRHVYEVDGEEVRNLVAELPGRERRHEIVVVGAHYDTAPGTPGANHNGTGVAALLALAKAMAGDQQERTVRFVAFVNREEPYSQSESMGSHRYARECRARGENLVSVLSLESIGHFETGNEGRQVSAPSSEKGEDSVREEREEADVELVFSAHLGNRFLADRAASAFMAQSERRALVSITDSEATSPNGLSDDESFRKEGFPAVLVTSSLPHVVSHLHPETDNTDQLNLQKLERVVRGLESVVRALANP